MGAVRVPARRLAGSRRSHAADPRALGAEAEVWGRSPRRLRYAALPELARPTAAAETRPCSRHVTGGDGDMATYRRRGLVDLAWGHGRGYIYRRDRTGAIEWAQQPHVSKPRGGRGGSSTRGAQRCCRAHRGDQYRPEQGAHTTHWAAPGLHACGRRQKRGLAAPHKTCCSQACTRPAPPWSPGGRYWRRVPPQEVLHKHCCIVS